MKEFIYILHKICANLEMAPFANHEQNREKVYAPCGRKIIFGNKKPDSFQISEKYEELIKKFVNNNFSLKNIVFP